MAAAPESVVLELDACAALRADLAARGAGARPWATEAAVGGAGEEGGRAAAPDAGDPGDPDDAARAAAWLPLVVGLERGARLTHRERPAHFRRQQPAWAAAAEALGEARYDRVGRRLARWRAPEPRLPLVQELLWALEQPEAAGFTRLALAGLSALAGLVPEEDVRLGYVLAQSARAVRTLGDSASAVQRYTVSEELGRRFNNRLLSTRATLGLGSTQVIHGNYPLARALFGRVLEEKAASAEFKAAARQGLLNAAVASEDWDTALQEGWHLLRAERSGAMAQVEVLNVLAHVCYCVGRYEAAAQAARLALKVATRPYQVMLAISILLNVSSEKRDLSRAREYGRALRLHIGRSAGPFEDARALLALSRFERTCGDASKAVENAAAALRIADRYRYHEISYRAEGILEDLATPTVSVSDGLGASGDQAATADLRTDSLSIIEMLGGLNEQSLQGDTLQLVDL